MERNHTPYEASQVECKDCFSPVIDADEEYCNACGEPTCVECSRVVNDEPLCNGCFAALRKQALKRLQNDPQVGDLFQEAA
jgi:formylmethanofuran dehydrogenase subunit E